MVLRCQIDLASAKGEHLSLPRARVQGKDDELGKPGGRCVEQPFLFVLGEPPFDGVVRLFNLDPLEGVPVEPLPLPDREVQRMAQHLELASQGRKFYALAYP